MLRSTKITRRLKIAKAIIDEINKETVNIEATNKEAIMKKRIVATLISAALVCALVTGCGGGAGTGSSQAPAEAAQEAEAAEQAADETAQADAQAADETAQADAQADTQATEAGKTDEELAKECADLIDAIYVQQRTETTDADIAAAKAAWDALTDAQKEMVEGEFADPDYFGRDTGDVSLDDPLNADEIGENELLVVSFGTSFNDSRATDIGGIEKALQEAFPDWSVRRAFTAQIIINHVQARDGEVIDNIDQALARAKANGVKNLVVQPTHLMHGAEYDDMVKAVTEAAGDFETVRIAEPLLGEVGEDATVVNDDKEAVAKAVVAEALSEAGYESLDAAAEDGTAFVFLGHGTAHIAKVTYSQMQAQMEKLDDTNVFIGTVEGEPEETALEEVIRKVEEAGYKKVILRPLMVVAGDHANNDMAGDEEDSWKSTFMAAGSFEKVDCQVAGLGRIADVQAIYVQHTADKIASDPDFTGAAGAEAGEAALEDGTYTATFTTDSSMFRVNEANNDKGILTVKDGKMTIHISLVSDKILNLFPGTAEEAQKEGAELLEPTTDEVTYSDGTTEEVFGFDVPVPAIGEEFDCALVGEKGKWYDHKVMVTDPVAEE